MRKTTLSSQFKRDLKKQYLQLVTPEWNEVYNCLVNELPLPNKYRDHPLKGDYSGYMDCHIKPHQAGLEGWNENVAKSGERGEVVDFTDDEETSLNDIARTI